MSIENAVAIGPINGPTPDQNAGREEDFKAYEDQRYKPEEADYSVNAHWSKRAAYYEDLARKVEVWSKDPLPTANDKLLAPYSLWPIGKCATARVEVCAVCKAVATLKDSYKSFEESTKDYATAKAELAAAEEQYATAVNQLLPNGPSDQNDRSLLDKAKLVAKDANTVAKDANTVADKAKLVSKEHDVAVCVLDGLATAGNRYSTASTRNKKSSNASGGTRIAPDPESTPSALAESYLPEVIGLGACDFLTHLDDEGVKALAEFHQKLKRVFGNATMLNDEIKDEEYRRCIKNTVKGIMRLDEQESLDFYTPGIEGQEIKGVQPILYAILVKMVQILRLGKHVIREQAIREGETTGRRSVDFVVSLPEEYLVSILPGMLGVPIEVKPINRKSSTVQQLLLEALTQVLGHLAKRAKFSFNFGGIGEDCKVFGLELTMGSVALIVLEVSGVGTADVKVTTQRTERMPLFDEVTRENIFGRKAKDVQASLESVVEEHPGIPPGLCLLARTLMSVQQGLGTSAISSSNGHHNSFSMRPWEAEGQSSVKFCQFLGSGAFSNVLKMEEVEGSNDVDVFMKVPKSRQLRTSLDNEATALQVLHSHPHIPKLLDTKNPIKILNVEIRCDASDFPCLPLKGFVGQPTSQHKGDWDIKKLEQICIKVHSALTYAHENHWAHLDVRPSNIITRVNNHTHCFEVMLIDWGCAYHTNAKKVKWFIGCPPYAHDELFGPSKQWKPRLDHDLASLAYSMVSLYEGSIPWSGFSNHREVMDDFMYERHKMASAKLDKLFEEWKVFSLEDKGTLLHAIDNHGKWKEKRKREEGEEEVDVATL